ncbi:DegT/DnrJ/EryC1/StrS family aminotransferase [Amedibacillus sp. YH-ame6]
MEERIYLSSPHMGGEEMKYIEEAFETNWIAPLGKNVDEFETEMKSYLGMENALALSCGTAGIHLALKLLGVKENDYVFCSSLTFSASCNPICYEKATPVFIDSDESWNMSPVALKKAMEWAMSNHKLPKAVIVVDLYGQSAKWDEIQAICTEYNVPIIEDAAEALGCSYKGKPCGSFGEMSIISFNGNKIITTSGGGMMFTKTQAERNLAFKWATQSRENERHYEHKEIGYNYRMSNVCAGIGRGQLKVLNERVKKKNQIYDIYKQELAMLPLKMMEELPDTTPTHWLSCFTINDDINVSPDDIITALESENIESRPVWKPMHLQPIFKKCKFFSHLENGSVSENLFVKGICLPSDTKMTLEQQNKIINIIKGLF